MSQPGLFFGRGAVVVAAVACVLPPVATAPLTSGLEASGHAHRCPAGKTTCVGDAGRGMSACFAPGTDPDYAQAAAEILFGSGFQPYSTYSRWSNTATDGATGTNGNPITLTYSFVPDYDTGDPTTSNLLHATFDAKFGSRAAWQDLFRDIFDDWSARTGIAFVEAADDGAAWPNSMGSLGVRGDVRIICLEMDGAFGVLAYNYFPSFGDMAIDKDENWADAANDHRFMRNVLLHELGHGIGLQHVLPQDGTKLMEAFLNLGFVGPQDDDIRGANSYYGDPAEPNATAGTAADLGAASSDVTIADLSLHAAGDTDWYSIAVAPGASVRVTATPVGATYNVGPDPGTPSSINTAAVHVLRAEVFDGDGVTLLGSATATSLGQNAQTAPIAAPAGNSLLLVRVTASGSTSGVQRYTLSFSPTQTGTHALLISSSGATGVTISLSPAASGGASSVQTPSGVFYATGTAVTLTAPTTVGDDAFVRWRLDNVDLTVGDRTLDVTMNAGHAAIAVFGDGLTVEAGAPQTIVEGEPGMLSATVNGGTPPYAVSWTPGATVSNPSALQTSATPTSTTRYTVTVTDSAGAVADDSVTINVQPALSVDVGSDRLVTAGQAFTLIATADGGAAPYAYEWSPQVLGASGVNAPAMTASVNGTTTFSVVVSDMAGRTAQGLVTVSVAPALSVSAGADQTILSGGFALLSATAAGGAAPYRYDWTPTGVALNSSNQSMRVSPTATADFMLTVTDDLGQEAVDAVRVTVASALVATANATPTAVRPGEVSILRASVTGGVAPYTYAWRPGEALSATNTSEVWATPAGDTTFTVLVTDAFGQSTSAAVRVAIEAADEVVAPELAPLGPAGPAPLCGFGFATVFPIMLAGPAALRRLRARGRRIHGR